MATEIRETFSDHESATKQKLSEELASNQRAIDEGGGDNCLTMSSCKNPRSTSNTTCSDAGAHECSSSKQNNNNSITELQQQQHQTKLSFTKAKPIINGKCHQHNSDTEDGFLSTSPDSANEELLTKTGDHNETVHTQTHLPSAAFSIYDCNNPTNCVSVKNILESFKAPLSEEQAWSLIYQTISLYRRTAAAGKRYIFNDLEIPDAVGNLSLHCDGNIHCSWSQAERKEKAQKLKQQQQRQQQQEDQSGGKF